MNYLPTGDYSKKHVRATSNGVNTSWHSTHRMPKNPTIPQRINWHLQHQKKCGCKPLPELVKKAIISFDKK